MTPEGWVRTHLGAVAGSRSAVRCGPFGSQLKASEYVADGVPVVMPRDLRDGAISTRAIARVTPEKAMELERFRVRAGDILLARRGEMGRCAQIESAADGWLCGTGCLRIRPGGRLDAGFLEHFLRSEETAAWLRDHAVGQTFSSLSSATLARVPIQLPGLTEQRRIAVLLESVDQAIRATRSVIHRTRAMVGRFFRRLLTEGPGRRFLEHHGAAFDPRSWPRAPLGSLCALATGHAFRATDRSDQGLPIIRIQNLNGSEAFHRFNGRPSASWVVEPGDLLFSWSGVKGSSFGPHLWSGPTGVLNQHIFKVGPARNVVKRWLFEILELVTVELEERAQGFKSSLLHVRKSDLTSTLVAVPPTAVQQWIAALSAMFSKLEATELCALDGLVRTKRGLERDLFSGRRRFRLQPDQTR